MLEDLVAYVGAAGATALRLAVAVENTAARRLYDRMSFSHVARRARQTWIGTTQHVDVLERAITSRV